ncbi:MAG TPA: fused MFS/spermidine synthase, partial [Terriglobia bacterium]|nr:fused MFS/spermidine synthase [Terriglobia bacterium]
GELARLKPPPEHLTSFYLMAALGGALGGLFVGLFAPHVFRGYYELPVSIGASAVLALIVLRRDPSGPFYRAGWRPAWIVLIALCGGLIALLVMDVRWQTDDSRLVLRNFYGSLRVADAEGPDVEHERRRLVNGTILHGTQFLDADRRRLPTTYYGPDSGVGLALRVAGAKGSLRVGVIGLGVGTLATYGRRGDEYTFYEINPLVIELAKTQFSFLADCRAKVDIAPGDARLSLERRPPQNLDLLAVDAFAGDSIPVHLLTREAVLLYFRHLKPDGILAVHVTNRYLDLRPVVVNIAASIGKRAVVVRSEADPDEGTSVANWVLVSDRRDLFEEHEIKLASVPVAATHQRVWTDDYSNLLGALK